MFRFEKLDVWRKAMAWLRQVYAVTSSFPDSERYGLSAQLRRCSVSVASNIAEGAGRNTDGDFVRFLEMAYGSLMEAVCQCQIAADLGYIDRVSLDGLRSEAAEIARMLTGLRRHRMPERTSR
ncbi:MAG: four helix bundle protein [Chthonomonadales bacterium]|nr:four helix bundle protein [Chthonomonadales bacterium]